MTPESIGSAIATLNSSIGLAKALAGASGAIEKAELKLRVAELIDSLADIKLALTQTQEEKQSLLAEIEQLRHALELKAKVVRLSDAYYETDSNGSPVGDPYCSRCWQVEHRLINLKRAGVMESTTTCPCCRTTYLRMHTPFPEERNPATGKGLLWEAADAARRSPRDR